MSAVLQEPASAVPRSSGEPVSAVLQEPASAVLHSSGEPAFAVLHSLGEPASSVLHSSEMVACLRGALAAFEHSTVLPVHMVEVA